MKTALVVPYGFLGDIMFASSIAERFIEDKQYDAVDYLIGFPQMEPLLKNNPYIRNVFIGTPGPQTSISIDTSVYDVVYRLSPFTFKEPPPAEAKRMAGCTTIDAHYEIYTDSTLDAEFKQQIDEMRRAEPTKKVVGLMANWEPKAFEFSEEEYRRGIDVPNKGYGGRWRNITSIANRLSERYICIPVGVPANVTQFDTINNTEYLTLTQQASILKNCDVFVGAEGGMANLAAGVGCTTILDASFPWQLYGPNGCIKKIQNLQLGPVYYFGKPHVYLNPFIDNEDDFFTALTKEIDAL